jgi:hypothetical protein
VLQEREVERVGGRRVVSATVWRDGGALQLVISGG